MMTHQEGEPMRRWSVSACAVLLMLGTSSARAAQSDSGDWLSYGRSSDEQRFSPLKQIDEKSVGKLGLAWSMDLPVSARTLEATPLAVNGVLYFTTSLSVVYAVDAVDGHVLWHYDPEAWRHNARAL